VGGVEDRPAWDRDIDAFVETYFRHFEALHTDHIKDVLDPDPDLLAEYRERRIGGASPDELAPLSREIAKRMLPPHRPLNEAEEADEELVFAFIDDIDAGRDLEHLWRTVMVLIERAPTDAALGFVAAAPLEDLIRMHGERVIGFLERDYPRSPRLRTALTGVWTGPEDSDIWVRVLACMDRLPPERRID